MPHVIVKMVSGRPEAEKKDLAARIVKDVMEALHCQEDSVSVAIEEVASREWSSTVYKNDIHPKWDALYKKPNYIP